MAVFEKQIFVRDLPRDRICRVIAREHGKANPKRLSAEEIEAIRDVEIDRPYSLDPTFYNKFGASKVYATIVIAMKDRHDELLAGGGDE